MQVQWELVDVVLSDTVTQVTARAHCVPRLLGRHLRIVALLELTRVPRLLEGVRRVLLLRAHRAADIQRQVCRLAGRLRREVGESRGSREPSEQGMNCGAKGVGVAPQARQEKSTTSSGCWKRLYVCCALRKCFPRWRR